MYNNAGIVAHVPMIPPANVSDNTLPAKNSVPVLLIVLDDGAAAPAKPKTCPVLQTNAYASEPVGNVMRIFAVAVEHASC